MYPKPSQISRALKQSYQQFILLVAQKEIPIPYRLNIPPSQHPARQGKSDPKIIHNQLIEDANEQKFNLEQASVKEIRAFMEKNLLGLDCSGFVYRLLTPMLKKIGLPSLQGIGLPHIGRTKVNLLTSEEFNRVIPTLDQIQPGDLIKIHSENPIPHVAIVIEKEADYLIYAHSSQGTEVTGVHLATITITHPDKGLEQQKWEEKLQDGQNYSQVYNPKAGDKVVRLKILNRDK